ncbi:hypothetical protein TVAG_137210 [Trichomonas vaginalis G3]|uniref:Cilia- and flagella-associated protein 69 ARM repeats domain-containing protein n=1 Tax=Trichomonas vaginalis (strain ATCC PRA-98 / G3) TaxID=412133 RepID=A2FNS3_TRIV3|nr:cilia- and flagella-associated protein 69 family [Trichomonas vaginalis G3]EAX93436.1 hypothetical protein TVAG_137210 [Trichomonas vaginalis G3]KAI5521024.1 cilia- and flagella-associated protein 69 family [Trichomonas vaginalis G3]|eukprot:XP_001306366.1 hypothetical protein [Trichomonas vaginalis G3]
MKSQGKTAPPGFALCNPVTQNLQTTYMSAQKDKIQELFSMDQGNCPNWQTAVLKELIDDNKAGFFVTDLAQLQELIQHLLEPLKTGENSMLPFLKQIISLSIVPFRKLSNGDDVRNFNHIGGFFASLCPVLKLPFQDLQIEAAKSIYWFAKNCGPLTTADESTFRHFYPITDDNALYSLIPQQLCVDQVIAVFCDSFTDFLTKVKYDPINTDILTLAFNSLFEFVKRGQSKHIPSGFLTTILNFIIDNSEIIHSPPGDKKEGPDPICTTRVLAYALMFIDALIQESKEAMNICISSLSTLWSFFVDTLFACFKNVQKCIRNEILGIIILTLQKCPPKCVDTSLSNKMFDLLQKIAQLPLDVSDTIIYSSKERSIRLTHEPVDIELLLLSQDLILWLDNIDIPPTEEFTNHQIDVLRGEVNKYLVPHLPEFTRQALLIIRFNPVHLSDAGIDVLRGMIQNPSSTELLFYTLMLMLDIPNRFKTTEDVKSLMALPRQNEKILSLVLSNLAAQIRPPKDKSEEEAEAEGPEAALAQEFVDLQGIDILKQCFTSEFAEVVASSIDCARACVPFCFKDIDQRFIFMLLDCADAAPTLLRYAFVGLFLDLITPSFVESAMLWRSLNTNANIQRTIVRWWRQEEERLSIKYDKCIIIDADRPLDGHPLVTKNEFPPKPDRKWLLDKNSLDPPSKSYKLDIRARLFLFLSAFPPLDPNDCKPTDRIKELMIRSYRELKTGAVWSDLKDQLKDESVKPLHDDKLLIENNISEMRSRALDIQEKQCEIWQQCENDRLAMEKRTYNQLADGLKTAQYVAENYKAIVNSQPVTVARSFQGRTVKGEDVLVRTGNLRTIAKQEVMMTDSTNQVNAAQEREKEIEENYINDCLKDESISYLVQLMKNNSSTKNSPKAVQSSTQLASVPSNLGQENISAVASANQVNPAASENPPQEAPAN